MRQSSNHSSVPVQEGKQKCPLPILPLEVIRLIVGNTGDLGTLANWARVNWAIRASAESLLWEEIEVRLDGIKYDELGKRIDGIIDPIQILKNERSQDKDPKAFLNGGSENLAPICRRAALVRHIFLYPVTNSYFGDDGYVARLESSDKYVIDTFSYLSPILINLRSVNLHACVSRVGWDALMTLPALEELRLWREGYAPQDGFGPTFDGLEKLRVFEIHSLFFDEAFPLGLAVRRSFLETLHITVGLKETGARSSQMTLQNFFSGLTLVDISAPENPEPYCGFPDSLIDLKLEDCRHEELPVIATPEYFVTAFSLCSKLDRLKILILDDALLHSLVQNLHLPALTHLYVPPGRTMAPYWMIEDHQADAAVRVVAEFVGRHQESLELFQVLDTVGNYWEYRHYARALERRLGTWLESEYSPGSDCIFTKSSQA